MKTSDMFVVRRITEDITMINDETRRKLREMSMEEMIVALDIQNTNNAYAALPFDDRIKMLVDYVYQEKYNGKVKRLLKQARFRIPNAEAQDIHILGTRTGPGASSGIIHLSIHPQQLQCHSSGVYRLRQEFSGLRAWTPGMQARHSDKIHPCT